MAQVIDISCPECGGDLVLIDGLYRCLDCGNEISEDELDD